jgi:hypothetical protein
MKTLAILSFLTITAVLLLLVGVVNPPAAEAVPSYARQTGLACSGCHYAPPELNPAGRRFKLLGYVDRADETKTVHSDSGKSHAALDLLAALPVSAMFETSYTQTKKTVPTTQNTTTQNGTFEFPQDVSLFVAGAWTTHVGSFLQVTYNAQNDHFGIDNTDIRYAKVGKLSGKELVYGLDLNNNPTVQDLWNSTPAWGFPWLADDFAPTPNASPIVNGNLAQDVAGFGAYAMWNSHLYLDTAIYRSGHIGTSQPNPGTGFIYNIRGVAPYWRVAWQESTSTTQFEVGTYGMHMRSTPNAVDGLEDSYTDWAVDSQYDRTVRRTDVFSLRGTYIRENSDLAASFAATTASQRTHHLDTLFANAEYHFGNRVTTTFGWFTTSGTTDPLLFPAASVSGNFNGDPKSAGYIASVSYWPWQNLQLGGQYKGYTHFNGAGTNYDGAARNASDNNTFYLVARFVF